MLGPDEFSAPPAIRPSLGCEDQMDPVLTLTLKERP
jgi:hypothetical protein